MNEILVADRADVLVLEGDAALRRRWLKAIDRDCRAHSFIAAERLIDHFENGRPVDLLLLGTTVSCQDLIFITHQIRRFPHLEEVPILCAASSPQPGEEARALSLGARDFVPTSIDDESLRHRLRNHLESGRALRLSFGLNTALDRRARERNVELMRKNRALRALLEDIQKTQDATLVALTSLAEHRDNETGMHIQRTQRYVRELGMALRGHPRFSSSLNSETIDLMTKSAPLHDIGKVAIPDSILLKPGRLEAEEWEVMKTHAEHGRATIEAAELQLGSPNSFLRYAREIAFGHHERWDGSGYPRGQSGEDIPVSARLMAVADVYDALISKRVYKAAFSHDDAVRMIARETGRHFDPEIVTAFLQRQEVIQDIARRFAEPDFAPAGAA